MTTNHYPADINLTAEERDRKNRRRKAILASGAVLGVGAVITLAAWNDTVFGHGAFGIGETSWNVQGSTVSATAGFTEYDSSPGGEIAFTVAPGIDAASLMPGQTATGNFWLKETDGNMGARVVIQPAAEAGNTLGQALRVTIVNEATGATLVDNQPLSNSGTASSFDIPAGDTHELRFDVTLPSNANPNTIADDTVGAIWEMRAESLDS